MDGKRQPSRAELVPEREDLVERVDGAFLRRPDDGDDGVHGLLPPEPLLQLDAEDVDVHARVEIHGHVRDVFRADAGERWGRALDFFEDIGSCLHTGCFRPRVVLRPRDEVLRRPFDLVFVH